jgi:hypothetical protein
VDEDVATRDAMPQPLGTTRVKLKKQMMTRMGTRASRRQGTLPTSTKELIPWALTEK